MQQNEHSPRIRNKTQILNLVAQIAVSGLDHSELSADDRADLYEGLGTFLAKNESEAARYAATCIRECRRAQQDFLARLASRKGAE